MASIIPRNEQTHALLEEIEGKNPWIDLPQQISMYQSIYGEYYEQLDFDTYIYIYITISAQFIIFRRSSLNSNNFTGEIVTSSEIKKYFTSA